MKPILKVDFVDFWPSFEKRHNYFYDLLSEHYEVVISDEPDFLFYSCYGANYLKYRCIRIFYSSENIRPDFTACDYALTFDYRTNKRHYRLPLYIMYLKQQHAIADFLKVQDKEEALNTWRKKPKFCCMVVSNPHSKKRINFFHKLSGYKHVDSGGRSFNNIGGPVENKLAFIKEYKFVLAFENSRYPGYTTEKLLEPLMVDSIPIYWGNPVVSNDFNVRRFINYDNFSTEEELIQFMLKVEGDENLAAEILMQPKFPGNKVPAFIEDINVFNFLKNIFSDTSVVPVARSYKKSVHSIRRKYYVINHLVRRLFRRTFR